MSDTNQQQQQQQMLRVVAALGKADFIQVFRYPLPPGLENYSNFVEASLDLSTIFSKVLLMTSTENQYTPLEFEDDLVAMLLNCVCYNTQSSDYGALAIRLLSDQLRDIFAESAPSLPLTRRWLQKTPSTSSSSDVENDNEEENFVMMRNTALKAVCLDAFHYLAGCEGFKTLVGNDKITSSQNSTIGAIYDYYNSSSSASSVHHHHLLPPCSLVELNERIKSQDIGLYYQNVDQVSRDIQLLIQTVIGARTPSTMTTSELNSLLQLRLVHCHRAFRVALDNLKKRLLSRGNAEDDSNHHQQQHHELPEKILDALTLHNCPIQKGLIEKQLSAETKKLIESKLSSSTSADDILNTLKVIVAVLIEKDGSISQGAGTVSFPLFDDQLLRSIDKNKNHSNNNSFSFSSLYILQCRLISGQLPQTMMDLLLSSSDSSSNKLERKDLIWKTIKGEVEKIITDIVSNYGVEHNFSTLGETFRKQLHTFVSEFL